MYICVFYFISQPMCASHKVLGESPRPASSPARTLYHKRCAARLTRCSASHLGPRRSTGGGTNSVCDRAAGTETRLGLRRSVGIDISLRALAPVALPITALAGARAIRRPACVTERIPGIPPPTTFASWVLDHVRNCELARRLGAHDICNVKPRRRVVAQNVKPVSVPEQCASE